MTIRSLLLILNKSLRQHSLSTLVTVFSVAIASGLMMAIFAINSQTRNAFLFDQTGFDAVLGARGSQLQLVMNSTQWKVQAATNTHAISPLKYPVR